MPVCALFAGGIVHHDGGACCANPFAIPAPMPFEAPVTSATLPYTLTLLYHQPVRNRRGLNQDRTAIYHNSLPSAESFLHQKQIGLRYVMSLADSADRETLSHAFV